MTGHKQRLGRWGEQLAAGFLARQGYTILAQNARTTYGEIDLVAIQPVVSQNQTGAASAPERIVVFVEVKTRSSTAFGLPEEAVSARKQAHMLACAQAYLQEHPELGADWRIDVVAIRTFPGRKPPEIVHFQNALS